MPVYDLLLTPQGLLHFLTRDFSSLVKPEYTGLVRGAPVWMVWILPLRIRDSSGCAFWLHSSFSRVWGNAPETFLYNGGVLQKWAPRAYIPLVGQEYLSLYLLHSRTVTRALHDCEVVGRIHLTVIALAIFNSLLCEVLWETFITMCCNYLLSVDLYCLLNDRLVGLPPLQ